MSIHCINDSLQESPQLFFTNAPRGQAEGMTVLEVAVEQAFVKEHCLLTSVMPLA
jgi:hypothetical protein